MLRPISRENLRTKCCTSGAMSSGRSRSGGDEDGKHAEAVVEVAAERAAGHHGVEVAVGGGDEPHVHLLRARAAQPLELLLLQRPQQLGLHVERDLADLVEEQRAAVRQLEAADLCGRSRP